MAKDLKVSESNLFREKEPFRREGEVGGYIGFLEGEGPTGKRQNRDMSEVDQRGGLTLASSWGCFKKEKYGKVSGHRMRLL